jgi:hypothetical protein
MNKLIEIVKQAGFEIAGGRVTKYQLPFYIDEQLQTFADLIRAEDAKKIAELKQENVNRNSVFYQLMKSRCIRPYRLSKYCIGSIELYGSALKFNRFKKKLLQLKLRWY